MIIQIPDKCEDCQFFLKGDWVNFSSAQPAVHTCRLYETPLVEKEVSALTGFGFKRVATKHYKCNGVRTLRVEPYRENNGAHDDVI